MKNSIKKILREQSNKGLNDVEGLIEILNAIDDGVAETNDVWGFDDALGILEEYFAEKGVVVSLRNAQYELKEIFHHINKINDLAEKVRTHIKMEIDNINPEAFDDTPVGNSRMDDHLRGGGSMGAL